MTTPTPKRGDIWLVDFDPTRGAEIRKTRPAVVVNAKGVGRLPLHIVVPVTDWKDMYASFPWFVQLMPNNSNGLTKPSGADTFQIKSVSAIRFVQRVGNVTSDELTEILKAIAVCIGYSQ